MAYMVINGAAWLLGVALISLLTGFFGAMAELPGGVPFLLGGFLSAGWTVWWIRKGALR